VPPHEITRLGAVVLTHGEHESYLVVISDLLEQGMDATDICVVHNPVRPTDPTPAVPAGAQAIRMPGNLGYANGMNTGMRQQLARGVEWVWLLTHDVRLHPGALAAMRAAAENSAGYGALGPLLLIAGTWTVFSLGGERSRFGHPHNAGFGTRLEDGPVAAATVRRCTWLDGSSIMLRAEALRAVGLYDPSLFIYAEDTLLCLRLEQAGWDVGVVSAARAEQSAGTVSRPGPVAFLQARNGLRYARELGTRGSVAAAVGRLSRETVHLLRVATTGPQRRSALIQAFTAWVGVLAFVAGRAGAPPTWLPGRGDTRA